MTILVTGSSGHLGEALVRTLRNRSHDVTGMDLLPSNFTDLVGSISDRGFVEAGVRGHDAVLHTATLHKPHVATHSRQQFIDTNITGTLNLLEASEAAGVGGFVFTSTTSTFGRASRPPAGAPAAWITEDVRTIPRNIYGVTKTAAENLCELHHQRTGQPCLILRTSRFFREVDDDPSRRDAFADDNLKINEYLNRRVDLQDAVEAHLQALARADTIGFDRYIVSATTPFERSDTAELRTDPGAVLSRRVPEFKAEFEQRGWRMFASIDRIYDNARARADLGWEPRYDFRSVLALLRAGAPPWSSLALAVGSKPYHEVPFDDGPYPLDEGMDC
jgi:nucleoside-diphosphate-sugar epimerase